MYSRSDVKSSLKNLLENTISVKAVWEGGSTATGFSDTYSDLDVCIVCEEHAVEEIFKTLNNHFARSYGIKQNYRLPEPTWHGFSQCFYQIENVPQLFYVDICVIKETLIPQMEDRLTENDRHGQAEIWFDPHTLINSSPTDKALTLKRCKKQYILATQLDFVIELEVKKSLERGNFLEAFPRYYGFLTRNLIPLMNIKYRPSKADFGTRYVYREYPEQDAEWIKNCMAVDSIDDMKSRFEEIISHYYTLKDSLKDL